jgi:benzoate/toluate 1,2-dioxygenase reductase subunit
MTPPTETRPPGRYLTEIVARHLLSEYTFELQLSRPAGFTFLPGQRIRLSDGTLERDYSLASAPADAHLGLCIRHVREGTFTERLRQAGIGTRFEFSGPHGHFLFQPSDRAALWVATGTGVAPFLSMARAGIRDATLLHGCRHPEDAYYADLLRTAVGRYVPCFSEKIDRPGLFNGRVTDYIASILAPGAYDFYLCGRRDMVRDVTFLVDDRFPGSHVYSEIFF